MLLRLGVVCKSARSPGMQRVRLGTAQAQYFVAPRVASPGSLVCLRALMTCATHLLAPRPPVRTLPQWGTRVDELLAVVREHPAPGLTWHSGSPKYLVLWTLRAKLLVDMRAGGIQKLGGAGMGIADFARLFPDSGRWVQQLADLTAAKNVTQLCESLVASLQNFPGTAAQGTRTGA